MRSHLKLPRPGRPLALALALAWVLGPMTPSLCCTLGLHEAVASEAPTGTVAAETSQMPDCHRGAMAAAPAEVEQADHDTASDAAPTLPCCDGPGANCCISSAPLPSPFTDAAAPDHTKSVAFLAPHAAPKIVTPPSMRDPLAHEHRHGWSPPPQTPLRL